MALPNVLARFGFNFTLAVWLRMQPGILRAVPVTRPLPPGVLMSPWDASYHEMALINQGVCLIHLNRGPEARRIYERVLELYPDSPLAEGTLKTMDAGVAAFQSEKG